MRGGLTAVVEAFALVDESVNHVNAASRTGTRPGWVCVLRTSAWTESCGRKFPADTGDSIMLLAVRTRKPYKAFRARVQLHFNIFAQ